MKPRVRLLLAGLAVGALAMTVAAPAGAQLPDVPQLGFEIDPTEGSPGDSVNGQVDVNDVAENCVTDIEELQERFLEFALVTVEEFLERYPDGEGPFPEDPPGEEEPVPITLLTDFLAWAVYGFVGIGVSGEAEIAEMVLPQLFVLTFADIATQDLVGELSNFDAATGQGSVPVPEVDPGFWAVAAACVMPSTDLAVIEQGVATASTFFIEEFGLPEFITEDNVDEVGEAFEEAFGCNEEGICDQEGLEQFVLQYGPTVLAFIVEFDALGFEVFCVLDADGECPAGEVPEPGDEPGPARPVVVQPAFTG